MTDCKVNYMFILMCVPWCMIISIVTTHSQGLCCGLSCNLSLTTKVTKQLSFNDWNLRNVTRRKSYLYRWSLRLEFLVNMTKRKLKKRGCERLFAAAITQVIRGTNLFCDLSATLCLIWTKNRSNTVKIPKVFGKCMWYKRTNKAGYAVIGK